MSEIEELIAHLETQKTTPTVDRLISKVKEQDREIGQLRENVGKLIDDGEKNDERWTVYAVQLKGRAEKAEGDAELFGENLNRLGDFYKQYREKAEARIKELEELLGEETYAERAAVRHYKRIKELEQELLWAADACDNSRDKLS